MKALAAVTLALAGATTALASDPAHIRNMNVSFSDLDLSRPADVTIARERVHRVARKLCTELSDYLNLGHQPAYMTCVVNAMASAEPGIHKLAAAASERQNRVASLAR
jgi:UrcA family protein